MFNDNGNDLGSVVSSILSADLKIAEDKAKADREAKELLRKQLRNYSTLTASELIDRSLGEDEKTSNSVDVPEEKPREIENVRQKASGFFPKPPGS